MVILAVHVVGFMYDGAPMFALLLAFLLVVMAYVQPRKLR